MASKLASRLRLSLQTPTSLNFAQAQEVLQECHQAGFRDFDLFAGLGHHLVTLLPQGSRAQVISLASDFSRTGTLFEPLFKGVLQHLQGGPLDTSDFLRLATILRQQNMQAPILMATPKLEGLTPLSASQLLEDLALLNLNPPELASQCEAHCSSHLKNCPSTAGAYLHSLFLMDSLPSKKDLALSAVEGLCDYFKGVSEEEVESNTSSLVHKFLLFRTGFLYVYPEIYREFPEEWKDVFRKIHRCELVYPEKRVVRFQETVTALLSKLKIPHVVNQRRGILVFDVAERDRNVVYDLCHMDRYYASSFDKLNREHLRERIIKGMGYKLIQIPFWHWNKIRNRKSRLEYMRNSRFLALKDRRELIPRSSQVTSMAPPELQNLGEYFFKKDRPFRRWSFNLGHIHSRQEINKLILPKE